MWWPGGERCRRPNLKDLISITLSNKTTIIVPVGARYRRPNLKDLISITLSNKTTIVNPKQKKNYYSGKQL